MPAAPERATAVGPLRVAWATVGPAPDRASGRGSAFGSARECRFGAERQALGRRLLADLIDGIAPGADPSIARRCGHCGGHDHGAPYAVSAPVVVSVSYAGRLVVVAAAHVRDADAVGVDVERGTGPLPGLAPLFAPLPPPDRAGWTRIEAALKADGRGLRVPPDEVLLTGASGVFRAEVPGGRGPLDVVTLADAPEGAVLSVALLPATAAR